MKVKITWNNPVIFSLHLYILGFKFDITTIDSNRNIFLVSDNKGIAFQSYSDAENYCQNQEYEIEANNDNP